MKTFEFTKSMDPADWSEFRERLTESLQGGRNTNAGTSPASYAPRQGRLRSGECRTRRPAILMPRALCDNSLIGVPPETRKFCAAVSLILKKAPHGLTPGSDGGEDETRATSDLLTTRSPKREVAADALKGLQRGDRKGIRGVGMGNGTERDSHG